MYILKKILPLSNKILPRWKPAVTVTAIIEKAGKFLIVQEHTMQGLRINSPAGHLEKGESIIQACTREVLEETAFDFTPQYLIGIYLSRFITDKQQQEQTFLRFAFAGELGQEYSERQLDDAIVAKLWLTKQQLNDRSNEHRTPLLMQNIVDYCAGQKFPLDALYTHDNVWDLNS